MVPHEGVENAITKVRHAEIREVAVSGRRDRLKGERLVIFYTPEDFDIQQVIAGLREEGLPNIWIPKADDFVKVDELPMLGSGKLDLVKLKNMVANLGK
jgi:acyl-[acyl-carrier-protein]-phospholipid O-acyltransferase/long-chain-fatty-acid--[acyl-carrier-protein] ligase